MRDINLPRSAIVKDTNVSFKKKQNLSQFKFKKHSTNSINLSSLF